MARFVKQIQNRPRSDPRPVRWAGFVRAVWPLAKPSVRLDIDVLGFRQEEEADHRGDRLLLPAGNQGRRYQDELTVLRAAKPLGQNPPNEPAADRSAAGFVFA